MLHAGQSSLVRQGWATPLVPRGLLPLAPGADGVAEALEGIHQAIPLNTLHLRRGLCALFRRHPDPLTGWLLGWPWHAGGPPTLAPPPNGGAAFLKRAKAA